MGHLLGDECMQGAKGAEAHMTESRSGRSRGAGGHLDRQTEGRASLGALMGFCLVRMASWMGRYPRLQCPELGYLGID